MANWYYYNKSGEKVGPITATALKALTQQGLITPETVLENGNGRSAVAGKVNGLIFPEAKIPPQETVTVPFDEVSFGSPAKEEVYGLALPESKIPLVEPNPFTADLPVEFNPFTGTIPVAANPFTGGMPVPNNQLTAEPNPFTIPLVTDNPFTGVMPTNG